MKPRSNYGWLYAALAVLLVGTACGRLVVASPEAAPATATSSPYAPSETPKLLPSATPTANPVDICPEPGADTSLYISKQNGYCLLVPAGFSIQPDSQLPEQILHLNGPRETMAPGQQEAINVVLSIEANGPAQGLDSSAYAREWHTRFAGPDAPYDESQADVGGMTATVLSNLPGYGLERSAFVVANGLRYRISLMPQPEDNPELADAARTVWEAALNTLRFFPPENPPQAVLPADVCPQETADSRLYVNENDGYCFLYPDDFEPASDFPGQVSGGPLVGTWEGGDLHTSLTVGPFPSTADQDPRQILAQRMEFVQPGSDQDTSLGGYPAVTFIDTNGPWPSRQAIVVAGDRAYTLLAQPLDPGRFPDAVPYLDRVWETVTNSIAFFDPWR